MHIYRITLAKDEKSVVFGEDVSTIIALPVGPSAHGFCLFRCSSVEYSGELKSTSGKRRGPLFIPLIRYRCTMALAEEYGKYSRSRQGLSVLTHSGANRKSKSIQYTIVSFSTLGPSVRAIAEHNAHVQNGTRYRRIWYWTGRDGSNSGC